MYAKLLRALPLWICIALAAPARAELPAQVRSLVDAEGDLRKAVAGPDARQAFLDRMAAMAVLLRPRPVGAADWLKAHPPAAGTWTWEPRYAEVSGGGDLGYTSGPWHVLPEGGHDSQTGTYVAIWRYHPQTGWKLLLHAATSGTVRSDTAEANAEPAFFVGKSRRVFPKNLLAAERESLLAADLDFARQATQKGLRAAFAQFAAPDVRVCRAEAPAGAGLGWALVSLPEDSALARIEPVGVRVAESGDLGYTYGTFARHASDADAPAATIGTAYVHVWRLHPADRPRLVLDLEIPVPPRE